MLLDVWVWVIPVVPEKDATEGTSHAYREPESGEFTPAYYESACELSTFIGEKDTQGPADPRQLCRECVDFVFRDIVARDSE